MSSIWLLPKLICVQAAYAFNLLNHPRKIFELEFLLAVTEGQYHFFILYPFSIITDVRFNGRVNKHGYHVRTPAMTMMDPNLVWIHKMANHTLSDRSLYFQQIENFRLSAVVLLPHVQINNPASNLWK